MRDGSFLRSDSIRLPGSSCPHEFQCCAFLFGNFMEVLLSISSHMTDNDKVDLVQPLIALMKSLFLEKCFILARLGNMMSPDVAPRFLASKGRDTWLLF